MGQPEDPVSETFQQFESGSGVDESKVKWRFFRLLNFLAPTIQNTSVRRCNLQV